MELKDLEAREDVLMDLTNKMEDLEAHIEKLFDSIFELLSKL